MSRSFHKEASPAAIATEVRSLHWLAEATQSGGAPVVELLGNGLTWLETRRLEAGSPSPGDAREFGRALARTHTAGADWFAATPPGLPIEQAVLAELPSPSLAESRYTSWGAFFAELRLLPYLDMARDGRGLDREEDRRLSQIVERVAGGEFDADQPRAVQDAHRSATGVDGGPAVARNHGDLWAGNVLWAATSEGVVGTLIDPSAHGGHGETDLAELALFGSPHLSDTYAGYQEVSPLADGWEERVPIHQLHMLLVHVVLFGGGYVSQALAVADRFA